MFPPGTLGHCPEYSVLVESQTKSLAEILTDAEKEQERLDEKSKSKGRSGRYSEKTLVKFWFEKSRIYLYEN